MQLEMTAKFYDEDFNPYVLLSPANVEYELTLTDFSGNITTQNGFVVAPPGVDSYTFLITIPVGTFRAVGNLLAGTFETFSCGVGP